MTSNSDIRNCIKPSSLYCENTLNSASCRSASFLSFATLETPWFSTNIRSSSISSCTFDSSQRITSNWVERLASPWITLEIRLHKDKTFIVCAAIFQWTYEVVEKLCQHELISFSERASGMTNCPDGPKAGHALTFQLDQLVGAGHLATTSTALLESVWVHLTGDTRYDCFHCVRRGSDPVGQQD